MTDDRTGLRRGGLGGGTGFDPADDLHVAVTEYAVKFLIAGKGGEFRAFLAGCRNRIDGFEKNAHPAAVQNGIIVHDDDIAGKDIQIFHRIEIGAVGTYGTDDLSFAVCRCRFADAALAGDECFPGETEQFDPFSGEGVVVLRKRGEGVISGKDDPPGIKFIFKMLAFCSLNGIGSTGTFRAAEKREISGFLRDPVRRRGLFC